MITLLRHSFFAGLFLLCLFTIAAPSFAANFQVNGLHRVTIRASNMLTPIEVQKTSAGALNIDARLELVHWTNALIGVGNPYFTLTDDTDRSTITISFGAKQADTTIALLLITDGSTVDSVVITAFDTMLTLTQPQRDYRIENSWYTSPFIVGYGDTISTSTNDNIGIYSIQYTAIDVTASLVNSSPWTITTPTIHIAPSNSMTPTAGYLRMELTRTGNRLDTAIVALECLSPYVQRDTILVISLDTAVHTSARQGIDLFGSTKSLVIEGTGATSTKTFTLQNTLSSPVVVSSIHPSLGTQFSVTTQQMLPLTLAPKGTLDVTINFTASNDGVFTDVLEIVTPGKTYSFPLTGRRGPVAGVDAEATRPHLNVRVTSASVEATLTNSVGQFTLLDILGRPLAQSRNAQAEWKSAPRLAAGVYVILAEGQNGDKPFRLTQRILVP